MKQGSTLLTEYTFSSSLLQLAVIILLAGEI